MIKPIGVQRTMLTQGIFDNTKKATTVTVLKPLSAMLPILGWLIAFQRLVTGACLTHVSISQLAFKLIRGTACLHCVQPMPGDSCAKTR